MPNKQFGELLSQGIKDVANQPGKTIGAVEAEIARALGFAVETIRYWRQGHVPQEPKYVEYLARYCVGNGRVDRKWVQSLLVQADYPNPTELIEDLFPGHTPSYRIFICYKGNIEPDQEVGAYLERFFSAQDYGVLVDDTRTNNAWFKVIDQQVKDRDLLVVLFSKDSKDSETLQDSVIRADEYRRKWGWPRILPVRVAYEGSLPYGVANLVDPRQYVIWYDKTDNERVAQDILAASEGRLPQQEPIQTQLVVEVSDDGEPVTDEKTFSRPLSEFDPRFFETPFGTVKLRDWLYIKRDADARLEHEIEKPGNTITLRGARQTGKSSLLVRGLRHARQNGFRVINLDMQNFDSDELTSYDYFLNAFAKRIFDKLRLDLTMVDKSWHSLRAPQEKLTYLLEDYILLDESDFPVILALDEADRLLHFQFSQDFFSLVRSWHNLRANDDEEIAEQWNKLSIVLVVSTEPYLLIPNPIQSPFNVGLPLYLDDFDTEQIEDLNRRHGSPVKNERDLSQMMALLNGHPYLTRMALYTMVTEKLTWVKLADIAASDQGPFGDHLRHHYRLLHNQEDLKEALGEVIRHGCCTREKELSFFRLQRAGLVKGNMDTCTCRCDLYRVYFEGKL